MKEVWRKIQAWCYKFQLHTITNALYQPKGKMGSYLSFMSFLLLIVAPGMFFTVFFVAVLIIFNFEIGTALKATLIGAILIVEMPIFYLMFRGFLAHNRLNKNGDLNEVEIWELQNKTQAKLKALTYA